MSRHEKIITAEASNRACYVTCKNYFTNIGYELIHSSFPSTLVFKKKGSVWTATEMNEITHQISIHFNELAKNETTMMLQFKFPDYGGRMKDKDMRVFEPILLSLQNEVKFHSLSSPDRNSNGREITHHEKVIERQIVKVRCRYCGALNNDGLNTCESCGARL